MKTRILPSLLFAAAFSACNYTFDVGIEHTPYAVDVNISPNDGTPAANIAETPTQTATLPFGFQPTNTWLPSPTSTESPPSLPSTPGITGNWRTYANPKYGYEIQLPLNWFTDYSDFDSQYYSRQQSPGCGGGGAGGVAVRVLDNPSNLSASDFLQTELNDPNEHFGDIEILSDRMGFAANLDVVLSDGYMGAGAPGPRADINIGKGKIVEISTEQSIGIPFDAIFSTFRLINSDPNIQELTVDIVDGSGTPSRYGDIEITTGEQKQVITSWGHNYDPLLSPDKTKVAYLSITKESVLAGNDDMGGEATSNNVWIINIDGTNPVPLTQFYDRVFRGDLHWLDNDRLVFSDGNVSVDVYSLRNGALQTVLGPSVPVQNYQLFDKVIFLYNSSYTYVLRLFYGPIAILDLSTFQVTMVSDEIVAEQCDLEFGPDNTTFLGYKNTNDVNNLTRAILDLKTGKVTYAAP